MIGGYVTDKIDSGGEWEYVLPIYVDNLTITKENSVGDVVLTNTATPSSDYGGMWNYQNFITITGNGVTIDGIDIKPNTNDYYEGVNKSIEILASGITLKDIEIMPYSNENQFSGSITFNTTDLGDSTIDNVKLYGWISTNYPGTGTTAGTLTTTNVTIDFTDNIYAGYFNEEYGYGWCPGIHNEKSGANVENSGLVIVVDDDIAITEQVLERLKSSTTIQLATDVDLNADATIGVDVTLAGIGKLVIPAGLSLTVEDGITMTNDTTVENNGTVHNNGTIVNNGTITGSEIGGTVIDNTGDEPFQVDSADGIGQAFDSGATNVEYTGAVESATRIPEVPSGSTLTIVASGGSVANPNGGRGFTVAEGGVIRFSGITTTSTFTVNGPDGSKVEFVGITGTGIKVTGGSSNIEGSFGTDSSGSITVTGESRLTGDVVLGDGVSLTVVKGTSLEIPSEMTLTVGRNSMLVNDGTIYNYGTISNGGAFLNDGHVGGTGVVDSMSGYISGSGTIDNEVIQSDWSGDDDYPVTAPEQPESNDDSEIAVIVAAAAAAAVLMCVFVLMGRGKI